MLEPNVYRRTAMATVFYVRESAKSGNIASSREVSVADIIKLYGPEPAHYKYMKGAGSPDPGKNKGSDEFFSGGERIVVKIEPNEIEQDTFPLGGFYLVQGEKP